MVDIFLSHSSKDDAIVSRIHDALEAAGFNVWVDHVDGKGVDIGDNFELVIQDALVKCKYGLFALSPNSAKSIECINERRTVTDLGKRLYVALIKDVNPEEFPWSLRTIHYVNLKADFETGINELVKALQGDSPLETTAKVTAQQRSLSGNFPRWHLDFPLMGRGDILEQVHKTLANGQRVTELLGLGGVGKTRLAAEIVNTVTFQHGVVWHKIEPHTTIDNLAFQIRDHLGLDPETELDMVWDILGRREVLLVLDNAEDCSAPAAYAERINALNLEGGSRVLVTSRYQWRELRNTKHFDLRAPDKESALAILESMIERENPSFSLNGYEEQIVAAAQHHPRLLHYAVRWANAYPADYVLETVQTLDGEDAQEALDDMVLKTIRQLDNQPGGKEALSALRRLTVCRGGFTFDAARAIINTKPSALMLLKQWGLVSFEDGRYDIEALVSRLIGTDDSARQAHFDYYLALAQKHYNAQHYVGLTPELPNLETAFVWILETQAVESAVLLGEAAYAFFSNRGYYEMRLDWVDRLYTLIASTDDPRLQARIHIVISKAYRNRRDKHMRGNLERAQESILMALELVPPTIDPVLYGSICVQKGYLHWQFGSLEDRETHVAQGLLMMDEAVKYLTPDNNEREYARMYNTWGLLYRTYASVKDRRENLQQALKAYEESARFWRPEKYPLDYATLCNNWGFAYRNLGELDGENQREYLEKAIEIYQDALKYRTPQSAPQAYALTMGNLGYTYRLLSNITAPEDNLMQAKNALEEALAYRTCETNPRGYAISQSSLGRIYYAISEYASDDATRIDNLTAAFKAFDEAIAYFETENNTSRWANTMRYKAQACYDLAQIQDRDSNLQLAIELLTQAMNIYKETDGPLHHAKSLDLLGQIHLDNGDKATAQSMWERSQLLYRQSDESAKAEFVGHQLANLR